ncbi:MAG: hypothetical protein ACRDXX_00560 [Stackebrandtia sp.]
MRRKKATDWIVVRQRLPRRALVRLATYLLTAVAVTFLTWLLFATEPSTLAGGEPNPAARATPFVGAMATLGVVLAAGPVLRPPQLAVNHYGVSVRPGAYRTLLLPWVHVEEIATVVVPGRGRGDSYLLFACDEYCGYHSGDRPRFLDRAALREANRATEGRLGGFDLALRLGDFKMSPREIASRIADYAPDHVSVVNQLDEPAVGPKTSR